MANLEPHNKMRLLEKFRLEPPSLLVACLSAKFYDKFPFIPRGGSMSDLGYYSQPTIFDQQVVFVSDDDLWSVGLSGGIAHRLTSGLGIVSQPHFSPDGKWVAFVATENGYPDIYLISALGGAYRKITHVGARIISQWKDESTLVIGSGHESWGFKDTYAYELNVNTLDMKKIDLGVATCFYYGPRGSQLLGRYNADSARWKRYKGGTAGRIWLKRSAKEPFKLFLNRIKNQLSFPKFVGDQVYFVSDFEGVANLYRCGMDEKGLKRLTHHLDYYVRSFQCDDKNIVYQCGADIYAFDLETEESRKIEILVPTTGIQTRDRFEPASLYLDGLALHSAASEFVAISRGHTFRVPTFTGAVEEVRPQPDARYSLCEYSFDNGHILQVASNSEHEEKLVSYDTKARTSEVILPKQDFGKIWGLRANPKNMVFAITNNRKELYLLDLAKKKLEKIDVGAFSRCSELSWSPDGRYLAYSTQIDKIRTAIKIYDMKAKKTRVAIEPVLHDYSPSFDPEGKYLYFLSIREFYPNYNETHFDLGFPFAGKPYAVSLQGQTPSPFEAHLENPKEEKKPVGIAAKAKKKSADKKSSEKQLAIEIEYDGIDNRIMAFPLPIGGYHSLVGIKGGILYFRKEIAPISDFDWPTEGKGIDLYSFRFEENSSELFHSSVRSYAINRDRSSMLLYTSRSLRLVSTSSKPGSDKKETGKKEGWIDGSRIRLKIDPIAEWKQMYREAWHLQKEHFWRKDMTQVDWDLVYNRYLPILDRVKTRPEFSDLMWEMQGELGTSHCYEYGGDYSKTPDYTNIAFLGAELQFDAKKRCMRIVRIFKGDSWLKDGDSPLSATGVSLREGDEIYSVNMHKIESFGHFYELLEYKAGHKVELQVKRLASAAKRKLKGKKGGELEFVTVTTNRSQTDILYRNWVEKNKQYVHQKSKGTVGYVHIPDMGAYGYAEFYRHFIVESQYDSLIVDVRYNGGGHVSQHILKVLAQKILGFDETRYNGLEKYPLYAVTGSIVGLTNEMAGSDGDIFSHSFKMMKLGKLIGKRTWGGVIGINGQYNLRDGTITTQPEFSFWFREGEWYVENYGTDPDIEVDITPEDYSKGRDPQLDRAIDEVLKDMKRRPPVRFTPSYYPDLSLPTELKRKTPSAPVKK